MRQAIKTPRISAEYVERGLERFRGVLRGRDLKLSKVRDAVARCALQRSGHFCVEDLVRALQDEGVQEAHLATVYRAMPLLVDAGLVQATLVAPGESQRYEVVFEREQHHHLLCLECGRMVEFQSGALEALQREIAERYGFHLDARASELHGRCKECRRAATPSNGRGRA
jgi:Fur family transcriptional regulator, ferric uptake regulator